MTFTLFGVRYPWKHDGIWQIDREIELVFTIEFLSISIGEAIDYGGLACWLFCFPEDFVDSQETFQVCLVRNTRGLPPL